MSTKVMKGIAYFYLLFPFLLFTMGWLKIYLAIPVVGVILISIFLAIREDKFTMSVVDNCKQFVIVGVIGLMWVLLSGIGGYVYQNADHRTRNAFLEILINSEWPVYGNTYIDGQVENKALCFYFGFWLPSALIGKILGAQIANYFMVAWAVLGLVLIFAYICIYLKKCDWKIILVLIFFSGFDFVRVNMTGETGIIDTSHIEGWNDFQYSSNTTLLFWVYHQVIYTWLITIMILTQKSKKNIVFLFGSSLMFSPFSAIGLLPYILYRLMECFDRKNFKNFCGEIFTVQNVLGGGVIGILSFLFLYGNPYAGGFELNTEGSLISAAIKIIVFVGIEVLAYLVIVYQYNKKPIFWITCIMLFIIPFIRLKDNYTNDFCMRVSVVPLFILMIFVLEILYTQKSRLKSVLVLLIVIGAITPIHEINRTVYYMQNEYNNITLPKQRIMTNEGVAIDGESLFFKYLVKETKRVSDIYDVDIYNLIGYTSTEYEQTMVNDKSVMNMSNELEMHLCEKVSSDLQITLLYSKRVEEEKFIKVYVNGVDAGIMDSDDTSSTIVLEKSLFINEGDNVIEFEFSEQDLSLRYIKIRCK